MEEINGELLERYLHGKCTAEEQARVKEWLEEDRFPTDLELPNAELGQEILLSLKEKHYSPKGSRSLRWQYYIGIAALMALAVGTFLIWNRPDPQVKQMVYKAPFGKPINLILPDSSRLVLQPGSVISYAQHFNSEERRVKLLSGEVFFSVQHRDNQPFVVSSSSGEIQVLGTRFNVRNLKSSEEMQVVLTQGKISFKDVNGKVKVLKPGQELLFDKKLGQILQTNVVDTTRVVARKAGILDFDDTPMAEVLELLGNLYGVQFKISCKLDHPISGNFTDMPIVKALHLIQRGSEYRFRNAGNTIEIYK
mgnify:CR=1 FL=1